MNYKITETKQRVFNRDGWICRYPRCFDNQVECAHGIAQTEANARMIQRVWLEEFDEVISLKQAWEIIHDDDNLFTSCRKHNSYFNFGNNPEKVREYLRKYRRDHVKD